MDILRVLVMLVIILMVVSMVAVDHLMDLVLQVVPIEVLKVLFV